ncbi:hypothetical protein EJB05_04477 [Eragrostis curvula]|uniref:Uncharacterized protein n=1 Tax=Eragrostis curvula TaxID=38414 RepID=A0A5J9W9L1_9POAL|nr:hypothetical protein EJB05_04477 [Eragrostis curvula]
MEKMLESSCHAESVEYSQLEIRAKLLLNRVEPSYLRSLFDSRMRKSCLLPQSTNKHKPIKPQIRHYLPSSAVLFLHERFNGYDSMGTSLEY